jgi:DNA-binding FadR family transcriptional regulator
MSDDLEQLERGMRLRRMTDDLPNAMTQEERGLMFHLHMLEATRTVTDRFLLSELCDTLTRYVWRRVERRQKEAATCE